MFNLSCDTMAQTPKLNYGKPLNNKQHLPQCFTLLSATCYGSMAAGPHSDAIFEFISGPKTVFLVRATGAELGVDNTTLRWMVQGSCYHEMPAKQSQQKTS